MQKSKIRFNILDFLIVAVVILCIVGVLLRGGAETTDPKLETQRAIVTYKVSNIQSASQHCFQAGDRIYSQSLGCDMGYLVGKVEVTPAVSYIEDDGVITKTVSVTDRIDLVGQFECEGKMSESGFSIGGTQYIAPGMSTYAYLPNINVNILITDVTVVE